MFDAVICVYINTYTYTTLLMSLETLNKFKSLGNRTKRRVPNDINILTIFIVIYFFNVLLLSILFIVLLFVFMI